jgi:hypothetical protein
MRSSGSTDGTRWTGRGRKDEWPTRRSFGNLNLSVRTRTSPGWVAVGASGRVRTRSASRSRIAAIRRGEWGRDRAREPRRDAEVWVDPGASRSGRAMRAGVDFRAKRRGGSRRVVGRSRTVVDAEYLEPPGLAGSPRGCFPVPGRTNHRGEPRRSPRATPQPRPRSPPVPSREGRTRGVGGRARAARDGVRRCDGRGARRHRRRRRRRHRGRARGTPIRPCVSRARAVSDARRVVEIQQRRGQSPGISVQKNPANRKFENLARLLTCQVLSWTFPLSRSYPKRPEILARVGAAGGCQEMVRAGSPSGRPPGPSRRDRRAVRSQIDARTARTRSGHSWYVGGGSRVNNGANRRSVTLENDRLIDL